MLKLQTDYQGKRLMEPFPPLTFHESGQVVCWINSTRFSAFSRPLLWPPPAAFPLPIGKPIPPDSQQSGATLVWMRKINPSIACCWPPRSVCRLRRIRCREAVLRTESPSNTDDESAQESSCWPTDLFEFETCRAESNSCEAFVDAVVTTGVLVSDATISAGEDPDSRSTSVSVVVMGAFLVQNENLGKIGVDRCYSANCRTHYATKIQRNSVAGVMIDVANWS